MTPEQKLQALMAAHTPPKTDLLFELEVQERVAHQWAVDRFIRMSMAVVVFGGLLVAMVWAVIQSDTTALASISAAIGAGGIAGLLIWNLRRVQA